MDPYSVKRLLKPVWKRLPAGLKSKISNHLPADYHRHGYYHVMHPFHVERCGSERPRVTMILPSVDKQHLTGGPATLVNYVIEIARRLPQYDLRFLPVMAPFDGGADQLSPKLSDFEVLRGVSAADDGSKQKVIVADAAKKKFPVSVRKNDIFIASMWPTFFLAKALQGEQLGYFGTGHKIQYLIQDYEPLALFPWSDFYLLARQTYEDSEATIAVVATPSLHEYLEKAGHQFTASYHFDPSANATPVAPEDLGNKKEVVLIYGRPDTPRNCFSLIFEALLKVTADHPSIAERFEFISVGEKHADFKLNNGAVLKSKGFMDPSEYKKIVLSASVGMFFVVSPHTGYVVLELAKSGALVISNSFETKKIGDLHPNIREPETMTAQGVADTVVKAVQEFWRNPNGGVDAARESAAERDLNSAKGPNFAFLEGLFEEHYKFLKTDT